MLIKLIAFAAFHLTLLMVEAVFIISLLAKHFSGKRYHWSFTCVARHMAAEGFFGQIIAGGLIGACAATAAHPFKFAGVAFSRKFIVIAQVIQNLRMIPDFGKGLLANISAIG